MKNCLFIDNHILVTAKDHNIKMEDFKENVKKELEKENYKSSYIETIIPMCSEEMGIVVFALSSKSKERLQGQIKEGTFSAKHLAVCVGKPVFRSNVFYVDSTDESFEIKKEKYVHLNKKTGKLENIPMLNEDAFPVCDDYKLLEEKDKISLVQIEGGFNHEQEVRFIMADAQSPIFGDKLYGGDTLAKNTNLALCLAEVKFKHPTTGKNFVFRCYPSIDKKPWSYLNVEKYLRI